jgi:SAM-dependent methyltransferase
MHFAVNTLRAGRAGELYVAVLGTAQEANPGTRRRGAYPLLPLHPNLSMKGPTVSTAVLDAGHWDAQYQSGPLPWETGRPSTELRRVLAERHIRPCRVIELGCGTGTNAVWLAAQGFQVTAVDLSPVAIRRARRRARAAGMAVHFLACDLRHWRSLGGPFDFFFDRGCYHALRLEDRAGYFATLEHILRPGALGLVLLGNDREPRDEVGPPTLGEGAIRQEFGQLFDVVQLREFRFDAPPGGGKRYLAWSCLVQRKPAAQGKESG